MPTTQEEAVQNEEKAVAPYKHKALVTFHPHICIPINGTSTFVPAAICEFEDRGERYNGEIPSQLTVVGLPDRPNLPKAMRVRIAFGHIVSAVFLEADDKILQNNS